MSKLRIFIEGEELDSLETVTVPITKQYEELADPTVICNDYSKTVTVPLSKHNNEVFGHCFSPDRLIAKSDDETIPLVGIYFDPYKKLSCRLQWDDDVFFIGYAKMLKVTNEGYEVTINGELGKIFQELQKITFDKTTYEDQADIDKYWIDGSKYVSTQINKELVYNCWNSTQDDYELRTVDDAKYDITDIIGFIANNSFSNDFDYKTVEMSDGTSKSMSDVLGEDFEANTGYSRDSVIGDGLYPVQMSQFRSYEQIPFIYWNKFWKIFQAKAEELTGYKWDYAESFFTSTHFNQLGITLLQRDAWVGSSDTISDSQYQISTVKKVYQIAQNQGDIELTQTSSGIDTTDYNVKYSFTPNFILSTATFYGNLGFTYEQSTTDARVYRYGGIVVSYSVTDDIGTTKLFSIGFCSDKENATTSMIQARPDIDKVYGIADVSGSSHSDTLSLNLTTGETVYGTASTKGNSPKISIKFEYITFNNSGQVLSDKYKWQCLYSKSSDGTDYNVYPASFVLSGGQMTSSIIFYKTLFHTDDLFTLNDICNFDFTNILDYCKRYRINIYADELNKKLVFTRNYFKDYTITDWTDKIDRSSTFDIQTTTFDNKYVLFGYKEPETLLGSQYKNIYKYASGAKRLDTNYNFNTETTTLFEKSTETILYTPTYIYWGDMILQTTPAHPSTLPFWVYNNNYLECRDDSGKTKDISGAYFFPTKKKIDYYWGVFINDDSKQQKLLDKYYNYRDSVGVYTSYWTSPELVKATTDIMPVHYYTCLFTKPKKNYTAQINYYDRLNYGIYEQFWETYLDERYNVQNKILTTYVKLSSNDFINFKFNQFWKIDNQIYMVNKIYDYDITNEGTTKVDLITVQNIEAYRK